ncbi:hypothetical protein LEMLEM_LOCUS7115, partial [Lemmus lemmus]
VQPSVNPEAGPTEYRATINCCTKRIFQLDLQQPALCRTLGAQSSASVDPPLPPKPALLSAGSLDFYESLSVKGEPSRSVRCSESAIMAE